MEQPKNKLSRVILGPDWVDLGYGDTPVVAEALKRQLFNRESTFKMPELKDWSYLPSEGLPALVKFLEDKYKARVIITNGAKQGVAAALYALKCAGHTSIMTEKPYWPSVSALFEDVGIKPHFNDYQGNDDIPEDCRAGIVASPANPDGRDNLYRLDYDFTKGAFIHDAAYYTEVYMDDNDPIEKWGDMQVFSYSKMFGMGGLRLGYVVCYTPEYAAKVAEFVERTSSSVSVASQQIVLNVEKYLAEHPSAKWFFVYEARKAIHEARVEFCQVDPEVCLIEDCDEFARSKSMFAWVKVGRKLDLKRAKVHALEGTIFGEPGMIRFNMAVGPEKIKEAVRRLNKFKRRGKR